MEAYMSSNGASVRASTAESYRKAVDRVICAMRDRLDEPLTLDDLAEVAIISPYHFDRVFRQVTGVPPCRFLGALRIQEAKRLLLTTRLRVTDICFEVGYNSLGTFLTRFTELVGVTPRGLRRQVAKSNGKLLNIIRERDEGAPGSCLGTKSICGTIGVPETFDGIIFVGLFPTAIPQSKPLGCAILTGAGDFHIPVADESSYYVLAAGFPWSESSLDDLLAEESGVYVGTSAKPVSAGDQADDERFAIVLRPRQISDPPILMAPPLLLDAYGEDFIEGDFDLREVVGLSAAD